MSIAANVFLLLVVDRVVPLKVAADFAIVGCFIGHHGGFALQVFADHWRDVGNASALHMEAPRRSAAMDQAENHMLVTSAAPLGLALHLAEESFVNLDHLARTAHRLYANDPHCLA